MSYCSRSRRRRFTVLNFKGWVFSRIYGHFQQHLYCTYAETNLQWNLDTAIRFVDPDSYKSAKFWRFGDVFLQPLFCWNSVLSLLLGACSLCNVCASLLSLHFIWWMSTIFLLLVCLTYWPRKYTTCVDPHVDNSRQVWSWYDHTLPSYSVFVCRHVTWPCDLGLRSFDLEHMSCMASHVTNTATK